MVYVGDLMALYIFQLSGSFHFFLNYLNIAFYILKKVYLCIENLEDILKCYLV